MSKQIKDRKPRKPSTTREDLHSAFKKLKSEKDGRSLEQLFDEADEQYLRRRGFHPDDLKQST